MSIVLSPPAVSGVDTWSLVDATGATMSLTEAAGYLVSAGAAGRWTAPVSFAEQQIPGRAGVVVRQVNVDARTFDLPITILGDNPIQIDERIKALARRVYARRGPIWLRVTDRSDNAREIRAYAQVELSEGQGARAPTMQRIVLSLRCVDAFWRDQAESTATYTTASAATAALPRPLPFPLASSTVLATANVNNDGDEDAYPVWTITGPGSSPALRNLTTGESLRLATVLGVGEQVIVDTRPSRVERGTPWEVYDPLGADLYGDIVGTPSLWPFVPGVNSVQIEMNDATADSTVVRAHRRNWYGP